MKVGRRTRIGLGVVLILLGTAAMFSSFVEQILAPFALVVLGLPLIPFALLCGGLWLVLRASKGAKQS
jgi:hypothetical protein